jgi:metal-responsive CopG/Arc/MetJ family transcriptional regulator
MTSSNRTSVLISLPVELVADIDLALFDPIRGKIKYGQRSRLIAGLLRRWLSDRNETAADPKQTEGDS